MINDYGLEFLVGDRVSFKPDFKFYANGTSYNEGVVLGMHGHTIYIAVTVTNDGVSEQLTAVRLMNEITSVLIKAEVQLPLLD